MPHFNSVEVILGTLIGSPEERETVLGNPILKPNLFQEKWHRILFDVIYDLYEKEPDFDIQTLHGQLEVNRDFRDKKQPSIVHSMACSFDAKEVETALTRLHTEGVRAKLTGHFENLDFAISKGESFDDIAKKISREVLKLNRSSSKNKANIVNLNDVKTEYVEWLWKNTIPKSMVTILDGDPGLGKSTLTAYMASKISRGEPFEGDDGASKPP